MGLDMYIYRVSKPTVENRTYTRENLEDAGMVVLSLEQSHDPLVTDIIPYLSRAIVVNQYYDMQKIRSDYNLPDNAHITMYSGDCIGITWQRDNGENVRQEISNTDIDSKYTLTKTEECFVYYEEEVSYWRKEYEKRDFFYDKFPVENCGYYKLNVNIIHEFNEKFNEDVPEEDCTNESALFYHEWY